MSLLKQEMTSGHKKVEEYVLILLESFSSCSASPYLWSELNGNFANRKKKNFDRRNSTTILAKVMMGPGSKARTSPGLNVTGIALKG